MSDEQPESPSVFERMYRLFMEKGGFAQPCVTEEAERFHMQRTVVKPEVCKHGKTALTCSECYLDGFQGWGR